MSCAYRVEKSANGHRVGAQSVRVLADLVAMARAGAALSNTGFAGIAAGLLSQRHWQLTLQRSLFHLGPISDLMLMNP